MITRAYHTGAPCTRCGCVVDHAIDLYCVWRDLAPLDLEHADLVCGGCLTAAERSALYARGLVVTKEPRP